MDYSDITLVECNRGQSIEGQSNNHQNNGQFTCRLGEALDLDAGDEITIENAFVSSLGCGGQNIQFKGEPLLDINGNQVTQDFEVTDLEITYDPTSAILGHRTSVKATNKSVTKKLQDNKTFFTQQYYKNNNGENMMYLPRRYGERLVTTVPFSPVHPATVGGVQLSGWCPAVDFDLDVDPPNVPGDKASATKGKGRYTLFNRADNSYTGKSVVLPTASSTYKVADCDYFIYTAVTDKSVAYLYTDVPDSSVPIEPGTFAPYFKPRTDNKRFTLFIRETTEKNDRVKIEAELNYIKANYGFNPLMAPYHLYTELKELTLPIGYNSPDAIEQSLTEQLQAPKTFTYPGTEVGETYEIKQPESFKIDLQNIFTTTTTETFMPIECGCLHHNDFMNWRAVQRYINPGFAGTTDTTVDKAIRWWNTHQYIMVKRPEIFILGRKLNDWSGRLASGEFNYVHQDVPKNAGPTVKLELNMEWTEPNLKLLRDLFKAQETYMNDLAKPYSVINEPPENQRFLHINSYPDTINDLGGTDNFLGNDGYYEVTGKAWYDANWHTSSMPIFFKYDKTNENNSNVTLSEYVTSTTSLTYGFAAKSGDKICIYPGLIGSGTTTGWREEIFLKNVDGSDILTAISKVRIGWDWHASSYGNVVMIGTNGLGAGPPHSTFGTQWSIDGPDDPKENYTMVRHQQVYGQYSDSQQTLRGQIPAGKHLDSYDYQEYMNAFYIGANNPTIFFDSISQHFGIKNLHTAENTGQNENAGSLVIGTGGTGDGAKPAEVVPHNNAAGDECYKINKRLNYVDFSPDMKPYHYEITPLLLDNSTSVTADLPDGSRETVPTSHDTPKITKGVQYTDKSAPETIYPSNQNIEVGAIFDAHSGVYWDIGGTCPEEHFDKSFWGILGFTFDQYNPTNITNNNGRQARVGTDNMFNLELATTNCQVVTTALKEYPMNIWGNTKYSCQLATPTLTEWTMSGATWIPALVASGSAMVQPGDTTVGESLLFNYHPAIVQTTQSIELRAKKLPKLMTRPYYTIRSNIIDSSKYIGGMKGGNRMPIVAICDKLNGNKDYFFTDAAGLSFTITKAVSITDITISIHDPDGTDAVIDNNSSVIFRISKNKNTNRFNILNQILQQQKKK